MPIFSLVEYFTEPQPSKTSKSSKLVIFNETIGQLTILEKLKPFNMHKLMTGLRIEQVSLPKLYDGYFVDGGPVADGFMYVFHGRADSMSNAVAKIIFRSRPLGAKSKLEFTNEGITINSSNGHSIRYGTNELGYTIDPHKVIIRRPAVGTRAASMDPPTIAEILKFPVKSK